MDIRKGIFINNILRKNLKDSTLIKKNLIAFKYALGNTIT